jgi:hypothetical protein
MIMMMTIRSRIPSSPSKVIAKVLKRSYLNNFTGSLVQRLKIKNFPQNAIFSVSIFLVSAQEKMHTPNIAMGYGANKAEPLIGRLEKMFKLIIFQVLNLPLDVLSSTLNFLARRAVKQFVILG